MHRERNDRNKCIDFELVHNIGLSQLNLIQYESYYNLISKLFWYIKQ